MTFTSKKFQSSETETVSKPWRQIHLSATLCHWHSSQLYKQKRGWIIRYLNYILKSYYVRTLYLIDQEKSLLHDAECYSVQNWIYCLCFDYKYALFQIYDGKYTEVFERCNGKYNKESKNCNKYCKYLHF